MFWWKASVVSKAWVVVPDQLVKLESSIGSSNVSTTQRTVLFLYVMDASALTRSETLTTGVAASIRILRGHLRPPPIGLKARETH